MLNNRNISASLVRDTLGESTNDVSALCTSSRINPWSKYKPVTSDDPVFDIIASQKGEKDYNVKFDRRTSISQVVAYFRNKVLPSVVYERIPAGYPKRLGDFRLYEHSAVQPLNETMIDRVYNKKDPATNVIFRNKLGLTDYNLTYGTIFPGYRFALLVLSGFGDFVSMVSAQQVVSNPSGGELNLFPANGAYQVGVDYTCYPMLINKAEPYPILTSMASVASDDFILLPVKPFGMKVVSAVELNLHIMVSGFNQDTGTFEFNINYTNKSGKDVDVDTFDMEIIGEEYDEELGSWVEFVADRWTENGYTTLFDGVVNGDSRIGGQITIPNYMPQANYKITAHANTRDLTQVTDGESPIQ